MSRKTRTFRCMGCLHEFWMLVSEEERHEERECKDCGDRIINVPDAPMVMMAAHPDGKRRFDDVRTQRTLAKAKAKARSEGDAVTERKVKREMEKAKS